MAKQDDGRGAAIQMELNRALIGGPGGNDVWYMENIACGAVKDVIKNGGTVVLVVNGDRFTLVQRPTAEEL